MLHMIILKVLESLSLCMVAKFSYFYLSSSKLTEFLIRKYIKQLTFS